MSSPARTPAIRAVEQLARLTHDFATLHQQLHRDRLTAGTQSLPTLATRYATAQGLTATSLSLLLSVAEQPWAHEVATGRSAVEYLGHLTRAAGSATGCITGAAAIAAEFHRIDGQPGSDGPRPARFRAALDEQLAGAAAVLKDAPAMGLSAARFIEDATRTYSRTTGASMSPDADRASALTGAPVKVTDTQHRALEVIARHDVRVYQDRGHRQHVTTGAGDRITICTAEALLSKGLIRQDNTTSLFTGQRLRLTKTGRDTLHGLGPALTRPPAAFARPAARSTARTR
ncbi:hypothetical protein ACH4PU_33890 [Streptomyces sp. NPDC021100]|uniref:hypothetical protein n=1 Tax=Streptomyces sp. NPDC021100 TaxID=3365114 RepID=UPI0037894438